MIIIFILLILGGLFIKEKNKKFDYLIVLFLCALQYFQIGAPDFESYETVYNYIGSGSKYLDTGYGWMILCKAGNLIGLTYREFEVLLLFVLSLAIRYEVHRIAGESKNITLFYSLYLLYPALLDLVQVRFFVATALVFIGICFLTDNKLKNYMLYSILVVFAASIHSSAFFYFVFLIIPVFQKIKKILIYVILFSIIVCFVFKSQLASFISLFINAERVNTYLFSNDPVGLYGIVAYVLTLTVFSVVLYQASIVSKQQIQDKHVVTFVNNIYIMSLLSWIALPLSSFDTNFFRVQRINWPLLYLVFVILINNRITGIKIHKIKLKIKVIGLSLALFGFVFYILWFTSNVITAYLI